MTDRELATHPDFIKMMEQADQEDYLTHYGWITEEDGDKYSEEAIDILETTMPNNWGDWDFVRVINQLAALHNS